MALGRAGMSVAGYDIVHEPVIKITEHQLAYGRSPHINNKPELGPRGLPMIAISNLGLTSMDEAVLTIFHEIYHHQHYAAGGDGGTEEAAEAYAEKMHEIFKKRTR